MPDSISIIAMQGKRASQDHNIKVIRLNFDVKPY